MNAETVMAELVRLNLVASAAVVWTLMLRPLVLGRFGARVGYWLWVLVPVIVLLSMLPAPVRLVVAPAEPVGPLFDAPPDWEAATLADAFETAMTQSAAGPALTDVFTVLWLLVAGALLGRSILNTRRLAKDPMTGPALVGVLRPTLVLPEDFATRFDSQERALILAHEDVHLRSGHTLVNALVEIARCICWFNPLAHIAANRIRADQELACDAAVIALHPGARRAYAQALLKTQTARVFLPLGCTWSSRSAQRLHERISMLARPALTRRMAARGAAAIALCGLTLGYAAWAQQPERVVMEIGQAPPAVWTPSAEAPPDTLSHELEGRRHDFFIGLAQQGDIDFVLFGTTDAEMFWWPARGKPIWERAFADIKAADFGSQGTSPRSLLWRMRNGELDGYRAKLIVLQAGFCMGNGAPNVGGPGVDAQVVFDQCTPILQEISNRQPQAKILLVPPFPRGFEDHDQWITTATQNQIAVGQFVDGRRIFYADFGERFFLPDGSHNNDMWARMGIKGVGVGIQPAAFEAFAEELQPWLDRFVR